MGYTNSIRKIYYRPIEAAIYWSELSTDEKKILEMVDNHPRPDLGQLSRWPAVYFYNELIYDGITHHELPCGKQGLTSKVDLNDPELTVRYVDLKKWIQASFTAEKPSFLFNEQERSIYSGVDLNALLFLVINHHLLKESVSHQMQVISDLQKKCIILKENPAEIKERSEATYLCIIGAMLDILVKEDNFEFNNQESIIDALLTHFPNRPGLSERTLRSKFAAARRVITTQNF